MSATTVRSRVGATARSAERLLRRRQNRQLVRGGRA